MKIVIIQGAFLPIPPLLGGAVEKMWFILAKAFVQEGHQVVQISRLFDTLPTSEEIEGVFHKRTKGYTTPASGLYLKWLDFKYTWRAIKLVPKDADVIVTNTFWAPLLIKAKYKCYVDIQRMPKGQIKFYKKAGRLRANSTPVATAIKQELPSEYFPKVVTIPNPIPFIPNSIATINRKKIVLYTGRIHPEKGLDILLKAYQIARLETHGWNLKIVGPWEISAGGGGLDYLKTLKALSQATSSIEFVGPIYNVDELNEYYKTATLFAYPSIAEKGETFGIAPLEAMAWGCVPVVSALECFQDFIIPRRNGLIFNHRTTEKEENMAECLTTLINNPVMIQQLSENALQVRQTHSVTTIAKVFLADFIKMI